MYLVLSIVIRIWWASLLLLL